VNPLRGGVRKLLEGIDVLYRRAQRLTPVGPVLFLGIEPLQSATLELANGTRVERGTPIGHLHFNNARAAAIPAANRLQSLRRVRATTSRFATCSSTRASPGSLRTAMRSGSNRT
jgi:hypothetical protein